MGLIVSFLIGFGTALLFASILYWLDRYEKEPFLLLGGVFLWGAIVAAGSAFLINTVLGMGIAIFTNSEAATELATGSIVAPLVEEILKGLAVLGVFLIFRSEFDSILDGIIYAGVAALGFAATENTYYMYSYGFRETGFSGLLSLAFIRIFLVGWQHPFYTSFIGIGLAVARLNRNWGVRILAPLLGLGMALFTHAFHNTLASLLSGGEGLAIGALFDWTGWLFMLAVILWAVRHEGQNLRRHLLGEVSAGVISPAQYQTAVSAWKQTFARLGALFSGRYLKTVRFYQACGELAHKKEQLARVGEEGSDQATLLSLRSELSRLAPFVQV